MGASPRSARRAGPPGGRLTGPPRQNTRRKQRRQKRILTRSTKHGWPMAERNFCSRKKMQRRREPPKEGLLPLRDLLQRKRLKGRRKLLHLTRRNRSNQRR